MRVLDPDIHPRESINDFLRANGIDPNRVPLKPFVYDGRKREIRVDRISDMKYIPRERLLVPCRYRVRRGHEPWRYIEARGRG